MRKIIIICLAVAVTGCGIYKPYKRPQVKTDNLYGAGVETPDSTTIGNLSWQQIFTDPALQALIEQGLANNTDLQSAQWRVKEAEASLQSARLAFLPSFSVAPQGNVSSFDGAKPSWTYNVPLTASWEIDIFSKILNGKRKAKALYAQTQEYHQAVKTQLIAGIANLYYTLLMLDSQYEISAQTASKWQESVETMRSLMKAGMTNNAGVSQTEANYYAIRSSLQDILFSIRQIENSLASLLGDTPHGIERGKLSGQVVPQELTIGVPVQLLANRPDIKSAEFALTQAYYATSEARSMLYPSLRLSGSLGWTNSIGMIVNPGNLLLSAAGSLTQTIFNAGANRARVKIAKAQQEEAKLAFRQALLNAGSEVNNALAQCQTARNKATFRTSQITSLETTVKSTQLLMQHGSSTYLEVLTAQQSLLAARLSQVTDKFDEIQGLINLYHALGGGRDME
ncbi:MAG: TolC family protein [Bacteroidales bacterium]